ncbi:MAG: polyprenyl synthetase family protein [Fibromonadaceae bacterium]|jgi:geranylgeranyl pyrophosphate synthase|nr:polyprenyl synthetase family protein [Fibromonadaceae bacterium]
MNFSLKYQRTIKQARDMVKSPLELSNSMMLSVAEKSPNGLRERITQTVARPGKRLRSILLFLLVQSNGEIKNLERAARVAASVEMLHLASLVHDDVIDRSEFRRGQRSLHSIFGNKIAVLAGDYMLAQSLIFVVNEEDKRIPQMLASSASLLVAGEILEIDLAGKSDISFEEYMEAVKGKTGSLLMSCAKSGAILAGYCDDIVEDCGNLGLHFGIAFQIIDDILDYGIGAENLGKKKFEDLQNGIITLPLLLYFQKKPKDEMRHLIKNAAEMQTANLIVEKLKEANSFEEAKAIACDHLSQATKILEKLPKSPVNTLLKDFFKAMSERKN